MKEKELENKIRAEVQNELPMVFCQDAEDEIIELVYEFLDKTIDKIIADWKHLRGAYNMDYEEAVDCIEDYLKDKGYLIFNPENNVKTK